MIYAKDIHENSPWQQLTPGGEIYEPATSLAFNTGDWRTQTPVFLADKCKQCLLCVPYCPDSAIPVKDGRRGVRAAASVLPHVPLTQSNFRGRENNGAS